MAYLRAPGGIGGGAEGPKRKVDGGEGGDGGQTAQVLGYEPGVAQPFTADLLAAHFIYLKWNQEAGPQSILSGRMVDHFIRSSEGAGYRESPFR